MATGKRYYWIKLKDSFMTSDAVDFMMSQQNGAAYVVLYQMLCLKTINTGGKLQRQIGEVIIPYDVEKIRRDTKWFSSDTIRIALELYAKFGLVYRDEDGTLVMTDHDNLVGSETDAAARMRSSRAARNAIPPPDVTSEEQSANIVTPDIRDKILDIRDKSLDTRDNNVVKENARAREDNDEDDRLNSNTLEAYATNNLMYLSPYNIDELISYRDSLPDDLIRYAIDQACANGVRKYAYVRSILNNYVENGFKTIGDVQAHESERKNIQPASRNTYDTRPSPIGNPFADVPDFEDE